MSVIVKRFKVRHNGKVYGPGQPGGQIITGLSAEEEARLIEGSNGTIEKYIYPEKVAVDEEAYEADVVDAQADNEVESENIADINPEDLIKPDESKKRGR